MLIGLVGCGSTNATEIIDGADGPTATFMASKENKTVVDDVSAEEGSTANDEVAASKESSELAKVSKKDIAEYNSYDEFIEDIKRLFKIMETSDKDTFFDAALQYEWFSYRMSLAFTQTPEVFGYLIEDIDGDGVDELLLGDNGFKDDLYGIDSMFTIRDGKVDAVFESGLRDGHILYKDGVIEHWFDYPNSPYGVEYLKYNAGNLQLIESAYYAIEQVDGEWREVYYYSDSTSQKHELTEKEYNEKCDELDNKYNNQKMPFQFHLFKDEL